MYQPKRFGGKPQHILNHQIKAHTIRVLDEEGNQLGIMATVEALKKARELGVDLIEIAAKATPPVCQLCEYGKFLYRQAKKEKEVHSAPRLKEVQLSVNIAEHDLKIKLKHTLEFLKEGHPVKVQLQLHGREKAHPELGRMVLEQFIALLVQEGYVQPKISQTGAQFGCVIQGGKSTKQPKMEVPLVSTLSTIFTHNSHVTQS